MNIIHSFSLTKIDVQYVAGELGVEPKHTESESGVLPLDDSPLSSSNNLIVLKEKNKIQKFCCRIFYNLLMKCFNLEFASLSDNL